MTPKKIITGQKLPMVETAMEGAPGPESAAEHGTPGGHIHNFDHRKDGLLILDPETGKITEVSPSMTELLGYSPAELIGRQLWELGFFPDEKACTSALRELQEIYFIRYDDLPVRTKAGQIIQVEIVTNFYRDGDHPVIRCNIRDVSHRKQMERELAERARLLDLSNDAIIVRDSHDQVILWNKGAEKLYGWTSQEVMGKHLHTLLKTEFPRPFDDIVAQLHLEGQFTGEVVQVARDGRRIPSLCRWVLDRASKSILTSYTDISDRKRAEEALETILKERTETINTLESLSSTIAHDLRAPIRAINGFTAALLKQVPLGDTGKAYAEHIQRAAERMAHLLDDLLQYSRLAYQAVPMGPVNLQTQVDRILEEMGQQIQSTHAEVKVSAPLPVVWGNPTLTGQVLSNLFGNALKFVAPGVTPKVLLRAESRGSFVRLWVEDNGIGIAPEYQDSIFGIFERLHSVDEFPGTGLGLAIIKRALERMGGSVGVESELGKGSRFWIELSQSPASI